MARSCPESAAVSILTVLPGLRSARFIRHAGNTEDPGNI